MHVVEHGTWKAYAVSLEKYTADSPDTDDAIVRIFQGGVEAGCVAVRRNGMARWAFMGGSSGFFVTRGDFAELERIVHEAAAWLWAQEGSA